MSNGLPRIGVLGPVAAWSPDGAELRLPGPRHREVLARLVAARGRVVPVDVLVDDLWDEPPAGAVAAVRTFVAALRRSLEPARAPRSASTVLVTQGPGYRIPATGELVDARRFEQAIRTAPDLAWAERIDRLAEALESWRGQPFGELAEQPWAAGEVVRLIELRLTGIEQLAETRLRHGRAEHAVADLEAHVREHPGRERAWVLLARALDRAGRRHDALSVVRQARALVTDGLGLDPAEELARLELEILRAETADPEPEHQLWQGAVTAYADADADRRSRLLTSADLLRGLALTTATGLARAQSERIAAVEKVQALDDPRLTADLLVRLEVPGVWAHSDDPAGAARLAAVSRDCLDRLGADAGPALRARLLALIGIETRGTRGTDGREAAEEAEALARDLGDPNVLGLALNARFLQSFQLIGGWPQRAGIGCELVELGTRHDLSTYQLLGHLISLQAAAATGDVATADQHAARADQLAGYHGRDLVGVFTTWYRALRTVLAGEQRQVVEAAYERAIATLPGCGMPGVARGLEPLTRLCLRLRHGQPLLAEADFGPNTPFVRPLLCEAAGRPDLAREELSRAPDPPPDHLAELRWALLGEAALRLGDTVVAQRVRRALAPAAAEHLGAGSGMLSLGPATLLLDRLG